MERALPDTVPTISAERRTVSTLSTHTGVVYTEVHEWSSPASLAYCGSASRAIKACAQARARCRAQPLFHSRATCAR